MCRLLQKHALTDHYEHLVCLNPIATGCTRDSLQNPPASQLETDAMATRCTETSINLASNLKLSHMQARSLTPLYINHMHMRSHTTLHKTEAQGPGAGTRNGAGAGPVLFQNGLSRILVQGLD